MVMEIPPVCWRSSEADEGQDGHDDNDQTDEIDNAVHGTSPLFL
jgi:hypothetical protein